MSLTHKVLAAVALAPVAMLTVGASAASAAPTGELAAGPSYTMSSESYANDEDGSLFNVSDNNVGPAQGCNNNVPTNVLGVQVPVSDLTGILGFDNDGNSSSQSKNCEQYSTQDN